MKFRRLMVFLVGVSMVFNNVAPIPGVSLGLFASAAYFLSMYPYYPSFMKLGNVYGKYIWNILAFVVLFTVINEFNQCGYNTPVFPFSLFMCFILMLFLLLHSIYDQMAMSICLYGIAFGGVLMSLFFALGVGIEIGDDMRLVMFGENSNALGIYMGLSATIMLNEIVLNDKLHLGIFRFLFLLAFVPIVSLLFATGSRTAFFIFALSVVTILLFYPTKSFFVRIAVLTIGMICCLYAFTELVEGDSIMMQRLTTTIDSGNSSGRDNILKSLWPYVRESPIWGYGQTGYVDISKQALRKTSVISGVVFGFSPHNVIVEILLYTGIVGLLLWIVVWAKIGKQAVVLFREKRFLTPLLMCIPILACIISGQLLTAKWSYIMYAYIMSEYLYYRPKYIKCNKSY